MAGILDAVKGFVMGGDALKKAASSGNNTPSTTPTTPAGVDVAGEAQKTARRKLGPAKGDIMDATSIARTTQPGPIRKKKVPPKPATPAAKMGAQLMKAPPVPTPASGSDEDDDY